MAASLSAIAKITLALAMWITGIASGTVSINR
jgi:hypothetical protein